MIKDLPVAYSLERREILILYKSLNLSQELGRTRLAMFLSYRPLTVYKKP